MNSISRVLKKETSGSSYPQFLFSLVFYNHVSSPQHLSKLDSYYFHFVTKVLSIVRFFHYM